MQFELSALQAEAVLAALQHYSAFLMSVRQEIVEQGVAQQQAAQPADDGNASNGG